MRRRYAALRGFDRFVANLRAEVDGTPKEVRRTELDRWEIVDAKRCRSVRASYDVFLGHVAAYEREGHAPGMGELPYVDDTHGFFLGYAVFVAPELPNGREEGGVDESTDEKSGDQKSEEGRTSGTKEPGDGEPRNARSHRAALPATLRIEGPAGWRAVGPWPIKEGVFHASEGVESLRTNYFAVGRFDLRSAKVGGMRLTVAQPSGAKSKRRSSERASARAELSRQIVAIARTEREFFQRDPRDDFTIIINRRDPKKGTGGAVRRDSIVLNLPRTVMNGEQRLNIYYTVAHELFHTWRCAPYPEGEPLRWFHEGFTDYFAWLVLREAGVIGEREWLARMQRVVERAESWSRRLLGPTLVEASKRFFANRGLAQFSYKAGSALALALDGRLRRMGGDRSLLGFMRKLLNEWCPAHEQLTVDDVLAQAAEYGGKELAAFWRSALTEKSFPDRGKLVATTDLEWVTRKVRVPRLRMGWRVARGKATVMGVSKGAPAYKAGLRAGDRMVRINDVRIVSKRSYDRALEKTKEQVDIEVLRDGKTIHVELRPQWGVREDEKLTFADDAKPRGAGEKQPGKVR
jgi:predicted metalloprotease with PDZ domain